jgi:hypothetical protein
MPALAGRALANDYARGSWAFASIGAIADLENAGVCFRQDDVVVSGDCRWAFQAMAGASGTLDGHPRRGGSSEG